MCDKEKEKNKRSNLKTFRN